MITIINFSHPIQNDRPDIESIFGDEYQVFDVPMHLDLSTVTLTNQITTLVGKARQLAGGNIRKIDCIIPPGQAIMASIIIDDLQQWGYVPNPGMGLAAVLIIEEFREMGYIPNILRFTRVPNALPPRFEAVEVVRLRQPHVEEADEGSFGPVG